MTIRYTDDQPVIIRRHLVLADLSDVMPEVQRLRSGYRAVGNWSLAQTCRHLADSFNGSIDGFGVARHRIMRTLLGRTALRRVFAANALDTGFTVTESLNPPLDLDDSATFVALEESIRRFALHTGKTAIHPFFGYLSHDEWTRLHRIHCAHHLSFLIPA